MNESLIPSDKKWVEVNLDAISHNFLEVRNFVDKKVKILAVVKNNAYGHGAVEVSRVLVNNGVDMLGVTNIQEGLLLREKGIKGPILVFGPFWQKEIKDALREELTLTIASFEAIEWLKDASGLSEEKLKVHLKIETGMGRLGFWPKEALRAAQEILKLPHVILEGVYTHLSTTTWTNKSHVLKQYHCFKEVLDILEKANISGLLRHISNSAALLSLPELNLDMVRTGTLLYGQVPDLHLKERLDLKDPWSMKARILYLKQLPPGYSVGYGRTFVTRKQTTCAIIPLGFADGFQVAPVLKPVNLWELIKGIVKLILYYFNHPKVSPYVVFNNEIVYILGKVGMQLSLVDVTDQREIQIGDVVTVPIRRTAVDTSIPRIYIQKEQVEKSV